MTSPVLISIVVPFLNEAEIIPLFFEELLQELAKLPHTVEIICIDNNSKDATFAMLSDLHQAHAKIKIIRFSNYFGKESAILAGLDHAQGDCCIVMDPDLEDPPALIPQLLASWQAGYEVVLATRNNKLSFWPPKKALNFLFYRIFNFVSEVKIPMQTGDFRLIDQKVYQAIRQLKERTRFFRSLCSWVGFKTTTISFERPTRKKGKSKSNFGFLWKYFLDALFSTTSKPLRIWAYIGLGISIVSFLLGILLIVRTLLVGRDVPGYASLVTVILFLGGIQFISLGVLGEYLSRVFIEVKQRPSYIIKEKVGLS